MAIWARGRPRPGLGRLRRRPLCVYGRAGGVRFLYRRSGYLTCPGGRSPKEHARKILPPQGAFLRRLRSRSARPNSCTSYCGV